MYDDEQIYTPNFRVQPGELNGAPCVDLFMETYFTFEDDEAWYGTPEDEWHHLARITPDRIITFPVFTNPHAQRYLSRRHGRIKTIIHERSGSILMPKTVDEALWVIELAMDSKVWNSVFYGLGLVKELDAITTSLMRIPGIDTIVVTLSEEVMLEGSSAKFPGRYLLDMRRQFDSLKRKINERVRNAKQWHVRDELLTKLDPKRFPAYVQFDSLGRLVEYRLAGAKPTPAVEKRERQETVKAVKEHAKKIAEESPQELLSLHAEIERVTLATMIERFEKKLDMALTEPHWQKFFEDNIFILSMLLARPVSLAHTQFHAQTSHIDGAGAQIGDFLFKELGRPLAIVEIKRPSTPLMLSDSYRNKQVYGPHSDLSGAITQVLFQQCSIRNNWLVHQSRLSESLPDVIKCFVIAGTSPVGEEQRRCFDIFRNACKDVEVITYDELLAKLKQLLEHLTLPAHEEAGEPAAQ